MLRIHRSTRERESGARSVPEAGARGCGAASSRREEEAGTSVTPLEGASKRPGRWVRGRGGDVPRAEDLARVMWRWPPSWEEARPAAGTQGRQGRGGDLPRSEGAPIPESPGGDTPPHPLLGLTALRRNRTAWLDSISHLPAGLFWVQIWGIRSEREEPQSVSPDLLPDCWLSPSPSSPLCTSSAVTLSSCPQNAISNSGEVTEGPWAQEGAQGLRPM